MKEDTELQHGNKCRRRKVCGRAVSEHVSWRAYRDARNTAGIHVASFEQGARNKIRVRFFEEDNMMSLAMCSPGMFAPVAYVSIGWSAYQQHLGLAGISE